MGQIPIGRGPGHYLDRHIHPRTREQPISGYFPGDITATNLFATGIVEVRKDLDKVAIGALLHMVQDSFSNAHAERGLDTGASCGNTNLTKPGQIQKFRSYARQSSTSHDEADTPNALGLHTTQISPSAVDVSRTFLTMWKEKRSWAEVSVFFDCVFEPKDRGIEADAGPYTGTSSVQESLDPSR